MIAAMEPFELDGAPPPVPVTADSPLQDILDFCAAAEEGFGTVFDALVAGQPELDVERTTEIIRGVDANDISLYIHRPTSLDGPVPIIVHTHGGGMVIGTAADPNYVLLRDQMAASGLIVVGVEFRNGAGKLGDHPFPAGLDDCSAGLDWAFEHKADLGGSKIVISGESGGGNLSIATTLKAKREGRLDRVDGVYAQCPYISGRYATGDPALPSLVENEGYFLSGALMGPMVRAYDPHQEHATNPLAWPYHAEIAELAGLPPHVISVNELDPLRDEGLAYARKLARAGVPTVSRTVNGTCHAGDLLFLAAMPDVFAETLASIHHFAAAV